MRLTDIAVRLAGLHETPSPAATRFDEGARFGGRVAVLPSAFNPPTRAHLGLLDLAAEVEGVSAVAALLSTNNVDKQVTGAPLSHRVGMLLAAQRAAPRLAVLGSNAARLVDQGEALTGAFPGTDFDFIVGYDTLVRVFDPRYYEEMDADLERFFAAHRLIAANRAQATAEAVRDYLGDERVRPYARRIVVLELDDFHAQLSSTGARAAAGAGADSPALEPGVAAYIREHGLYRGNPKGD
jgi:nicotinic acid mononucleotide adenylyltransferase